MYYATISYKSYNNVHFDSNRGKMMFAARAFSKLSKVDQINIDDIVFPLHYKMTSIMLLIITLFTYMNQYVREAMICDEEVLPHISQYCFLNGTYIIISDNETYNALTSGIRHVTMISLKPTDKLRYQSYYGMMSIVLLIQSIFFYVPRYLWVIWEGEQTKKIMLGLDMPIMIEECEKERKILYMKYFIRSRGRHNFYALRFLICQILNLINVIGQIFFINYFLGGDFLTYGVDVLHYMFGKSIKFNPMLRIFPNFAHCSVNMYGIQRNTLCVLPMNFPNQTIFLFLWYWLFILSIFTTFSVVIFIAIFQFRFLQTYLVGMWTTQLTSKQIKPLIKNCRFGDWFMLYQLNKNIDSLIFESIIVDLTATFESINRYEGRQPLRWERQDELIKELKEYLRENQIKINK